MAERAVLIDASNLRSGGGVQVAASFLDELATLSCEKNTLTRFPWLANEVKIHASSEVANNLGRASGILDLTIRERRGSDWKVWKRHASKYSVSFVLFGPEYGSRRARFRIVGFADGVSLFARPAGLYKRNTAEKWKWALRARLSRILFCRVDQIVVEAQHVKDALVCRWQVPESRISIVPNTLNEIFNEPDRWEPVPLPDTGQIPRLCYVTRAYPHKNLQFLGEVGERLLQDHEFEVRFLLTLSDEEWVAQNSRLRSFATNLGPLTVAQLPMLYRACDASVFPSLLESFSITPLEAMASNCLLLASNRPFVRDIAGGSAAYFDPTDAKSAAEIIAEMLKSSDRNSLMRAEGSKRSLAWPTARDRAWAYLEIIDKTLARN